MAEHCKEKTNGKILFRIYPGGVAGDDPDMVRKMRIGQLHAAALTSAGLQQIAHEIQALQMPMMVTSYDELDYVMERITPKLEKILEAKGFKVLNWGDAGWVHFFAQSPVVHIEDLKSMRIFVWNDATETVEAWKEAGYHPVPLPATEIYTGLQSGLINAFATTPLAALSFQWFGLAKHMTDLHWAPLIGGTVVSIKKWKIIPEDMRKMLLKSAHEAGNRMRNETRKLGEDAVTVMKKYGLLVHSVPPHVFESWERIARTTYPKLIRKGAPTETLQEVERLIDAYRASKKGR
jgi:TRAP-type C4-dicarboxylate transport system substrate-binding protein